MQRTSSCRFMAPIIVICTYVQRRQQRSLPWLTSRRNRACGRGRKEVKRGGGVKEGPPFDARAILGRPVWLPIDRSAYSNRQSNEGAWNTNPCMAQYSMPSNKNCCCLRRGCPESMVLPADPDLRASWHRCLPMDDPSTDRLLPLDGWSVGGCPAQRADPRRVGGLSSRRDRPSVQIGSRGAHVSSPLFSLSRAGSLGTGNHFKGEGSRGEGTGRGARPPKHSRGQPRTGDCCRRGPSVILAAALLPTGAGNAAYVVAPCRVWRAAAGGKGVLAPPISGTSTPTPRRRWGGRASCLQRGQAGCARRARLIRGDKVGGRVRRRAPDEPFSSREWVSGENGRVEGGGGVCGAGNVRPRLSRAREQSGGGGPPRRRSRLFLCLCGRQHPDGWPPQVGRSRKGAVREGWPCGGAPSQSDGGTANRPTPGGTSREKLAAPSPLTAANTPPSSHSKGPLSGSWCSSTHAPTPRRRSSPLPSRPLFQSRDPPPPPSNKSAGTPPRPAGG